MSGIDAITQRANTVAPSKEEVVEPVKEGQKPSTAETEIREAEKDFVTGNQNKETTTYYGAGGVEVEQSDAFFAKKITSVVDGTESNKYVVAIYNGSLYNPSGPFSRRAKSLREFFTWKPCSESCFKDYLSFLETNREPVYWRANRSLLNE